MADRSPEPERLSGDVGEVEAFARELAQLRGGGGQGGPRAAAIFPGRIDANPESAEQGLAKIVLALIDILRRLMEKQAIRRIEGGSLTDEEIERMGETFLKLEQKMEELKVVFGLRDEDLDLDLGPLKDLL